jgi:hypothetical protein
MGPELANEVLEIVRLSAQVSAELADSTVFCGFGEENDHLYSPRTEGTSNFHVLHYRCLLATWG